MVLTLSLVTEEGDEVEHSNQDNTKKEITGQGIEVVKE